MRKDKNMKKFFAIVLLIILTFNLCACGKPDEVVEVEKLIDAIGEVSITSGAAISAAQESYNALPVEFKEKVANADILQQAIEKYEDIIHYEIKMDKYIMVFFKDYMETRDLGQTFFNCEVEYIISGEYNDLTIKEDVEEKIVLLRNILNLFYLYTCQEKREIAMALASSITPGAMAFITQGILLETWAFAEAKNDIKLLYDNNAVPLLKDDDNWALTADNVFDIEEGKDTLTKEEQREYILPQKVEGLTYSDYLKILLKVVPEETKALRIMDLIQINMKYTYYDSFLIKEYNCGLSYRLKINDIEYRFEDKYVKE